MGIDKLLKSSERLDDALKSLEEFEETMDLIKQYPVKPSKLPPPCPPYEPTNISLVKLPSYNF